MRRSLECSGPYLAIAESMPVSATAYAEIDADASARIITLNGSGTGMTVSSAAAIIADSCATGSNAPLAVPCGTITTRPPTTAFHEADPLCQHSAAGGDGEAASTRHRLRMAIKPLTAGRRRNNGSLGEKGIAAIEFALIAPVLLLLLLGMVQFGLTVGNYVMLINAASVGAMQFAISRSDTTPYTDTVSAIKSAAPTLTPANLTITFSVNGTACATDSACSTALTAAAPSSGGSLQPAAVTVAYPCGSQLTWYNFWTSTCQLTSTMTEGVQ